MFRRGLVFLAIACGSALAACSLLLGEGFTDSDGDPTNDSGTPGADAPPNGGDASSDASVADGAEGDTSTPRTDAGTACPDAKASLCDDFERSDPKGTLWPVTNLGGGGALTIETSATGNRRLFSKVTSNGDQAQVWKPFVITPTRFHLELSIELSSFASGGAVYIAGIGMYDGANPPSLVYLFVDAVGLWLVQQLTDGPNYHRDPVSFEVGAMQRVAIDLEFNGSVVVTVDSTKVIDANAKTYLLPRPLSLHVGAASIDGNGGGVTLRIDDIVFTAD